MSTRCFIGIKSETETIGIYCHNDGYPSGTGATLLDKYNTEESVRALIAMGDASYIVDDIEKSRFYHRDRGEPLANCASGQASSFPYSYIFIPGTGWTWYRQGRYQGELTAADIAG